MLVEDDKAIAAGIEYSLLQEGFSAVLCHDFRTAQKLLDQDLDQFDLCLFDLSLPDGIGYDLCDLVKKRSNIPVIFLTVIDDEVNVVMGLDMGADDYITKPFRIRELISRIKSVMRRYSPEGQVRDRVEIGDIQINVREGKVYKMGAEIILTALEYRLLLVFANLVVYPGLLSNFLGNDQLVFGLGQPPFNQFNGELLKTLGIIFLNKHIGLIAILVSFQAGIAQVS